MTPPTPTPGQELAMLAKRLSNALLKIRPLGGSEMFIRVGEEYYADPDYCGKLIEQLRNDLHEARKSEVLAGRESAAALSRARAEAMEYRECFDEITAKATPYGNDEHVTSYVIPAGPLHRAAGKTGHQAFNVGEHLNRMKAALEKISELSFPTVAEGWSSCADEMRSIAHRALSQSTRPESCEHDWDHGFGSYGAHGHSSSWCRKCGKSAHEIDREEAARSDSGSAGAPRAMREAAHELLDAETYYRHQYESHGGSHMETGRAWDRMRNAAAQLRSALHSPRPKEE